MRLSTEPGMTRDDQPIAFSVRQFCTMHAIGRTTFYEQVKCGRLSIRKLGKRTLVLREEAERWLEALPCPTPPRPRRANDLRRHNAPNL